MPSAKSLSQDEKNQRKTRLLLALWALGGAKHEVKRTEVTDKAKRKKQSTKDYQKYLKELETLGAITITTQKRLELVFLTDKGLELLGEGLKSPDFEFEGTIVGTWAANALLKWIGEIDSNDIFATAAPSQVAKNGKSSKKVIKSYENFKEVTLEVYDELNRDYNLDNLVPIYRIRRKIGGKVSRENFNEWMLEMQEKDILQLMAGEMPDMTPDKREDSITIPGAGLRYYAKQLT